MAKRKVVNPTENKLKNLHNRRQHTHTCTLMPFYVTEFVTHTHTVAHAGSGQINSTPFPFWSLNSLHPLADVIVVTTRCYYVLYIKCDIAISVYIYYEWKLLYHRTINNCITCTAGTSVAFALCFIAKQKYENQTLDKSNCTRLEK